MAFRARRQGRKLRLMDSGFLPFEAHTLSAVALKVPYVRSMIAERKVIRKQAIKQGWSRRQYEDTIVRMYKDQNWVIRPTARRRTKTTGNADPWAMLRWFRQRHIDLGLPYEPPPRKKKRRELRPEQIEQERERRKEGRKRAKERKESLESRLPKIPANVKKAGRLVTRSAQGFIVESSPGIFLTFDRKGKPLEEQGA